MYIFNHLFHFLNALWINLRNVPQYKMLSHFSVITFNFTNANPITPTGISLKKKSELIRKTWIFSFHSWRYIQTPLSELSIQKQKKLLATNSWMRNANHTSKMLKETDSFFYSQKNKNLWLFTIALPFLKSNFKLHVNSSLIN